MMQQTQTRRLTSGTSRTLIALSLAFLTITLDTTALNVALPHIQHDFNSSLSGLQWVVSTYVLTFASFLLTAGKLADRFGSMRAYKWGVLLFVGVSVFCGLSWNLVSIAGFRLLQGIGAAIVMTSALALLAHEYPESSARAKALGVFTVCGTMGLSGGPVIGGLLTDAFGWRAIFLINVLVGVAIFMMLPKRGQDQAVGSTSLDVGGQVLSVLALGALATTLIEGAERGWSDIVTLIAAVATIICTSTLIALERRTPQPMLPLSLFTPRFSASAIGSGTVVFSMYGLIFFLSLFFNETKGLSASLAGLSLLPLTMGPLPGNIFAGRFIQRFGSPLIGTCGLLIAAVGAMPLLFIQPSTPYIVTAIAMGVIGVGSGLVVPAMAHSALAEVPTDFIGVGSATVNTCRQIGILLGVAILGSFAGSESSGSVHGIHQAAAVIVAVLLVVAVIATVTLRVTKSPPVFRQPA